LSDSAALARLVEGADAVAHVAAVYRTAGHPDAYYRDVNVGGTERLLEAAALALRFNRERGLPVVIVRPGAIYGPGETRLLKLFRAIARGRYAIVGSGRPHYHLVFIDDLVQGFLLALDRKEAAGEAFIIAGPRSVSQNELAAEVARATGGR